jgi:hypothetical protein
MTAKRKLTEITRGQFNDLLRRIEDDSLLEKWTEEYEPQNKADLVESRQIRALGCLIDSEHSLKELEAMEWSRLEFWTDGKTISLRMIG